MSSEPNPNEPAPRNELHAVRWLDQVIAARDVGLTKYTPAELVDGMRAEQDETFEVLVPVGILRHLRSHITRLKARELNR
jgi:hypothetical protein